MKKTTPLAKRFRQFYPVVIDIETAGFHAQKDALLEIGALTLRFNDDGLLEPDQTHHYHVEPYPGLNLGQEALAFTGIQPFNPFRFAVSESKALQEFFQDLKPKIKSAGCQRAVLVGHNPHFDLSFLLAAIERNRIAKHPFHHFTTFDTATLSALVFGQTVLAKACTCAGLTFDSQQAHGALYDAQKTAELFCFIVNRWKRLTR